MMSFRLCTQDARWSTPWRCLAVAISGWLLYASFPPLELTSAVWCALVPLLLMALLSTPRQSFRWGFAGGMVFWVLNLGWFWSLSHNSPAPWFWVLAGWLCLATYSALYVGVFCLTVSCWGRAWGTGNLLLNVGLMMGIAALWVGFEYMRSVVWIGFPWNQLGICLYRNLPVIQIAEWTGVYGVSALIVVVNAGIALTVLRYVRWVRERGLPGSRLYRPHVELFVALLSVLVILFQLGPARLQQVRLRFAAGHPLVISAIQPNIPQTRKWSDDAADTIIQRLDVLTREALAGAQRPELILWPETAVPDCLREKDLSWRYVQALMTNDIPMLVGSMDVEGWGAAARVYNSTFLLTGTNGMIADSYAKQRLVPIGEYIPLSGIIPALGRISPMGLNCSAGQKVTVFQLPGGATFSVLICFEDAFPALARRFVQRGARLLINQTNDGWLDPSCASVQHLGHSVLRAVENRVPVVRVANTGVTAFIAPYGLIYEQIAAAPDGSPVADSITSTVFLPEAGMPLTFYARHGDWVLALPCAILAAGMLVLALIRGREKDKQMVDAS